MDTLGGQIKKYREFRKMTQKQLAEKLGESSGSVIYNWEKGIGRPDCDKLVRLCNVLDISADELLGCKSMSQHPTVAEWSTIQKYRALDEHGKEVVDYLIEKEYVRSLEHRYKNKVKMLKLNCYTLSASAGRGTFLDSEIYDEIVVPETEESLNADFVVIVSGNSMEPTYHSGDKVFVEKCDAINAGEIGIFVVNGEGYIKESGDGKLISHNEKYKPIRIGENDSVYCCGRVIGIVE